MINLQLVNLFTPRYLTNVVYCNKCQNVVSWYVQSTTPLVPKQKLCFRKSVGLRSFFAFLAQNCVHCIVITKQFLAT